MELSGLVVGTYLTILLTLALYGFHRSTLVYLYYRIATSTRGRSGRSPICRR